MFQNITINKFIGLNSNVDPSLINDGEARDILNLRHEKMGKLVSRNGSAHALFLSQSGRPNLPSDDNISNVKEHPLDDINEPGILANYYGTDGVTSPRPYTKRSATGTVITGFLNNRGVVGIGEIIFDNVWEQIDSDRCMIYAVRSVRLYRETASSNSKYDRPDLVYLFSPLTGRYKDTLLYPEELLHSDAMSPSFLLQNTDGIGITMLCDPHPMGTSMYVGMQASIPNEDGDGDDWIDQHLDINQYQYKIIISDRINGDMQINDAANYAEDYSSSRNYHSLHLSANCLEKFNVDSISLANRFNSGEENDISEGVTHGMGLYKFKAQKTICNTSKEGLMIDGMVQSGSTLTCNSVLNPVYSTEKEPFEFNNLLKPIEFELEEYYDDKGIKKYQRASNVFIWHDCPLKYYPSTGKKEDENYYTNGAFDQLNDNNYYLTANDRGFNKTNPSVPKVVELNEHADSDKNTPLGVWRYRFVWDYGNGIYSAPSAEILCPDIMWSAVPNPSPVHTDFTQVFKIIEQQSGSPLIDTSRFVEIGDTMPHTRWFEGDRNILTFDSWNEIEYNSIFGISPVEPVGSPLIYPQLLTSGNTLTSFGQLVYDVKKKLLYGNHNYARITNGLSPGTYDYFNIPLMYRIISDGDITLRGDFIKNKAGDTIPLTLRNLNGDRARKTCNWFSAMLHPYGESGTTKCNLTIEIDGASGNATTNILDVLAGKVAALKFAEYKSDYNWVGIDKNGLNSFYYTQPNVPAEVKSRLIASGHIELNKTFKAPDNITDWAAAIGTFGNNQIIPFSLSVDPAESAKDENGVNVYKDKAKLMPRWSGDSDYTHSSMIYGASNFTINALLPAERLLIIEQLTSYFPSSLLFNAPRVGISIPVDKTPKRAKKLLIFRTKSSHSNDYSNSLFGLVAEKDIQNDSKLINVDNRDYHYFFDDTTDSSIDFGLRPEDFEGLTTPLASRFNHTLNEITYYGNFKRKFVLDSPRYSSDDESRIEASSNMFTFYFGAYNPNDVGILDGLSSPYKDLPDVTSTSKMADLPNFGVTGKRPNANHTLATGRFQDTLQPPSSHILDVGIGDKFWEPRRISSKNINTATSYVIISNNPNIDYSTYNAGSFRFKYMGSDIFWAKLKTFHAYDWSSNTWADVGVEPFVQKYDQDINHPEEYLVITHAISGITVEVSILNGVYIVAEYEDDNSKASICVSDFTFDMENYDASRENETGRYITDVKAWIGQESIVNQTYFNYTNDMPISEFAPSRMNLLPNRDAEYNNIYDRRMRHLEFYYDLNFRYKDISGKFYPGASGYLATPSADPFGVVFNNRREFGSQYHHVAGNLDTDYYGHALKLLEFSCIYALSTVRMRSGGITQFSVNQTYTLPYVDFYPKWEGAYQPDSASTWHLDTDAYRNGFRAPTFMYTDPPIDVGYFHTGRDLPLGARVFPSENDAAERLIPETYIHLTSRLYTGGGRSDILGFIWTINDHETHDTKTLNPEDVFPKITVADLASVKPLHIIRSAYIPRGYKLTMSYYDNALNIETVMEAPIATCPKGKVVYFRCASDVEGVYSAPNVVSTQTTNPESTKMRDLDIGSDFIGEYKIEEHEYWHGTKPDPSNPGNTIDLDKLYYTDVMPMHDYKFEMAVI